MTLSPTTKTQDTGIVSHISGQHVSREWQITSLKHDGNNVPNGVQSVTDLSPPMPMPGGASTSGDGGANGDPSRNPSHGEPESQLMAEMNQAMADSFLQTLDFKQRLEQSEAEKLRAMQLGSQMANAAQELRNQNAQLANQAGQAAAQAAEAVTAANKLNE